MYIIGKKDGVDIFGSEKPEILNQAIKSKNNSNSVQINPILPL